MNTVKESIARLEGLGYALYLVEDRVKFRYARDGEPPLDAKPLLEALRANKSEVMALLKGRLPKPFLDADGGLVIPFMCDPRFHWWAKGQPCQKTEEDIKGWLH